MLKVVNEEGRTLGYGGLGLDRNGNRSSGRGSWLQCGVIYFSDSSLNWVSVELTVGVAVDSRL